MNKKSMICALAGCVVASMLWAAPTAADPEPEPEVETITVAGYETDIPTDCHRNGTGVPMTPRWSNVTYPYSNTSEDVAGATPVAECGELIFEAMLDLAAIETELNWMAPIELRDQLLTGPVDLRSPYQVYLRNILISLPMLASLSDTEPGADSGVGSCEFHDYVFIIDCQDDGNGRVLLRDDYGNPRKDWNGNYMYLYLSGGLSQLGATMYGSVLLQNDEGPGAGLGVDTQKHEQVHAQQWAKWGWDFGGMFISESLGDPGDALWHLWTYGVERAPVCFNIYERAAKFAWTSYPCPHNWL